MPARTTKRWTLDEDERLQSLVQAGRAYAYVAEKLKRTPAAVRGRAVKLGLTADTNEAAPRAKEPWTPEEENRLRILMAEGKTARAIASHVKRTTRAIRRRAEILGLSWREAKE